MQLTLEKDYLIYNYNLDNIKNGIVYIIGPRSSGRTTILKDILIQKRGYPIGRIFTMTECDGYYYSNFCNQKFISIRYNSNLLKEVIDTQKKNNKDMRIIIFDDVLSSKAQWMEDENIIELFDKSKELNILAIFCFQFSLGPPKLIESADQLFILRSDFSLNRQRIYNHYASDIYKNFKDFDTVLEKIFNEVSYNASVIDKKAYKNPTNVNEVIFKFQASKADIDDFKPKYPYALQIYDNELINSLPESDSSEESSTCSELSKCPPLSHYFESRDKQKTIPDFIPPRNNKSSVDSSEILRKIKIDLKNDNVTIVKDDKEIEITF